MQSKDKDNQNKEKSSSSFDELDEDEQQELLRQYSLGGTTETIISADGDQLTVHHPHEPKHVRSKIRLRDFFVAEFGIYNNQN